MRIDDDVLLDKERPGLIDTHCHLDLSPLSEQLEAVLADARHAGVSCYVVPGVNPGGWENLTSMAERHPGVYPAFGIHPMHAGIADDDVLARLASIAGNGVAIGEIGLDPDYAIPLESQERVFRDQLRLAVSLRLPVLIHCRRAFQRTFRILQQEGARQVGGIMHAYSGSLEMAREFIRLGLAISVSGMVTRDNSLRLRKVVCGLPLEELVLETDAPDLTPQRHRGKPNQPAYLLDTLSAVARIKGVDPGDAARLIRTRTLATLARLPER